MYIYIYIYIHTHIHTPDVHTCHAPNQMNSRVLTSMAQRRANESPKSDGAAADVHGMFGNTTSESILSEALKRYRKLPTRCAPLGDITPYLYHTLPILYCTVPHCLMRYSIYGIHYYYMVHYILYATCYTRLIIHYTIHYIACLMYCTLHSVCTVHAYTSAAHCYLPLFSYMLCRFAPAEFETALQRGSRPMVNQR